MLFLSVVFECGFSKPITQVSLEDVPMLHKAIAINSCLVPIKAELDQIKEGLGLFNVDELLKKSNQDEEAVCGMWLTSSPFSSGVYGTH